MRSAKQGSPTQFRFIDAEENLHWDELLELSRIGRLMDPPENVLFGEIVREALERLGG